MDYCTNSILTYFNIDMYLYACFKTYFNIFSPGGKFLHRQSLFQPKPKYIELLNFLMPFHFSCFFPHVIYANFCFIPCKTPFCKETMLPCKYKAYVCLYSLLITYLKIADICHIWRRRKVFDRYDTKRKRRKKKMDDHSELCQQVPFID